MCVCINSLQNVNVANDNHVLFLFIDKRSQQQVLQFAQEKFFFVDAVCFCSYQTQVG